MSYRPNTSLKRKKTLGSYRAFHGLGSYAVPWAANKIGSWWKNRSRKRQATDALKKRLSGSLTTTMFPRKGQVTVDATGSSESKCHFGTFPKFPKYFREVNAPQIYAVNNAGAHLTAVVGKQNIYQIPYLTYTDLNAITSTTPNGVYSTSRVLIERIEGEHLIANAASSACIMFLYDVIARRDSAIASFDPSTTVLTGIDDEGGTNTDYNTVGATPQGSDMFNQFYKIVQTTRIVLAPGGIHRHNFTFDPNRPLHGAVVKELVANANCAVKDLSIFTMVRFYGQPAHDSTTDTSVSTANCALDVITSYQIRYRWLQNSATSWSRSNNLGTTFAVGEQFVNEAVGQVQDATGLHPGTLAT